MNIIIVGCGKVGYTLAKKLTQEDNNVVMIDNKQEALEYATEAIDVMGVRGNALSPQVLKEAGVSEGDIIICVTSTDEINILCCLTAKLLGVKNTVARIRDPGYALELSGFREKMGINVVINPELLAAMEISRLLRFPVANDIDTFVGGKVELVSFRVSANDILCNKQVAKIFPNIHIPVLLAVVERGEEAFIPKGDMVLKEDDTVRVLGRPSDVYNFMKQMGKHTIKIKDTMIIGGGKITHYLVNILSKMYIKSKIIEIDMHKCEQLSEKIEGGALIINADGTDEELLQSENIRDMDSVVCLTDRDEENAIVALYALQCKVPKVIAKINRINSTLIRNLGVESQISPKNLTADQIVSYVRGLSNNVRNNIQTLSKIVDEENNTVEALEFKVTQASLCINIPLKDLPIKKDVLIGCVIHNHQVTIARGDTKLLADDIVIIIVKNMQINDFDDILIA